MQRRYHVLSSVQLEAAHESRFENVGRGATRRVNADSQGRSSSDLRDYRISRAAIVARSIPGS